MAYRVCSFTGHREIKKQHKPNLNDLLLRAVGFAYSKGCRDFYVGGAIGFDTYAARAVIDFRRSNPDARLVLALPCKNQSEHWSLEQKNEYENIMSLADEIIYISDAYTDGCMKKRNTLLADRCDILIAYVSRSNSGAAQTVRLATSRGKEIYNLYPSLDKNN